jgi:hypothetical protein
LPNAESRSTVTTHAAPASIGIIMGGIIGMIMNMAPIIIMTVLITVMNATYVIDP